ncbi:hypothetical protein [Sphaerotilus sp.]|nr:hypothetical protein [Sphaerotilus sp.]MDZ7856781.1 hypothetical protein [Sphaerotilus sp.]
MHHLLLRPFALARLRPGWLRRLALRERTFRVIALDRWHLRPPRLR